MLIMFTRKARAERPRSKILLRLAEIAIHGKAIKSAYGLCLPNKLDGCWKANDIIRSRPCLFTMYSLPQISLCRTVFVASKQHSRNFQKMTLLRSLSVRLVQFGMPLQGIR